MGMLINVMAKMLLFVISADSEKINTAVGFASRRKDKGDEVRFLVFGPAENFIAEHSDLIENIDKAKEGIHPKACVFIAKQNELEDKFKDHMELVPAGEYVSKSLEEGYSVITF